MSIYNTNFLRNSWLYKIIKSISREESYEKMRIVVLFFLTFAGRSRYHETYNYKYNSDSAVAVSTTAGSDATCHEYRSGLLSWGDIFGYGWAYLSLIIMCLWGLLSSCNKLVEIGEPISSITTSEVFSDDATATSALTGIYNYLDLKERGTIAIYAGLSSDELVTSGYGDIQQFQYNQLLSTNGSVSNLWTTYYYGIYSANAVIDGLNSSTTLTNITKNQLMGEAKFLRAFCYFQLVNLFGDVPLLTSIDWNKSYLTEKKSSALVFQQMISDLNDAKAKLNDWYVKSDNTPYPTGSGERVRANKAAAAALLSKVYLYTNQPDSAEALATIVINNSNYSLVPNAANVFKANSTEAIWQLQPGITYRPFTTVLGNSFIPVNTSSTPDYYVTDQFLNSFETGDVRKTAWLSNNSTFYYPYKYKIRMGTYNTLSSEYTMMLRLAEQYLIRAEARANNNNLTGAIADVNIIRSRANLTALPASLNKTQVLAAIAQERRIELFAERGDRWFDLKRTGQAQSILSVISYKQPWNNNQLLYPIPSTELQRDPLLIQNPGY